MSLNFGSSERVFQGVEAVDEAELEAEYSLIRAVTKNPGPWLA